MFGRPNNGKSTKIELRAAQIRQSWSPRERALRMGLPPDMPSPLRNHLAALPVNSWPPAGRFQLVESRLIPIQKFRHEN